jgi:hypothetical protein
MLAPAEPHLKAKGTVYQCQLRPLVQALQSPAFAPKDTPSHAVRDANVPSWLRQLVEAPTTERLTIRRVTRELHLLLEQRDLQTINILLGLAYNRQLPPSAQAALLGLTFSARHLLSAWSEALEDAAISSRASSPWTTTCMA